MIPVRVVPQYTHSKRIRIKSPYCIYIHSGLAKAPDAVLEMPVVDSVPARGIYLKSLADEVRRRSLRMAFNAQLGHPGGDLSAADILAVLYGEVLRFDANRPAWSE